MGKGLAYENNETDHWLTPPQLIKIAGPFDLDPCATPSQPWRTATIQYCLPEQDGLLLPWEGFTWCNPPYGKEIKKWIGRMSLHNNGLMLTFARLDTEAFRDVWKYSAGLLFFYGRISFYKRDGTVGSAATAPSVLIAFGNQNIPKLSFVKNNWTNGAIVSAWSP